VRRKVLAFPLWIGTEVRTSPGGHERYKHKRPREIHLGEHSRSRGPNYCKVGVLWLPTIHRWLSGAGARDVRNMGMNIPSTNLPSLRLFYKKFTRRTTIGARMRAKLTSFCRSLRLRLWSRELPRIGDMSYSIGPRICGSAAPPTASAQPHSQTVAEKLVACAPQWEKRAEMAIA
jgi:hypothetical protein